jgi:DNA-binding CsgD family transcriptional regulator
MATLPLFGKSYAPNSESSAGAVGLHFAGDAKMMSETRASKLVSTLGSSPATKAHVEAPLAFLVMTNVEPESWCAAVRETPQVIGRGLEADIRIPPRFRHVSRRHAEVWAQGSRLHIRDLNSASGTHINGVWLDKACGGRLAIGDRIWMGGLEMRVVQEVSMIAQVVAEGAEPLEQTLPDAAEGKASLTSRTMSLPTRFILAELSQAEIEIVLWMTRGCVEDDDLAKKLVRSPNTVRTQMNSIFRKLNVHSRAEVIAWIKRGK